MSYFKFSIMWKSWPALLLLFVFNCSDPKKDVESTQEATAPSSDQLDGSFQDVRSGMVTTDMVSIEYFIQGEGEVIVLLSGRGLDVGYLEPLATQLAESGFQTIRINRRGAGKSTGPFENLTYHTHATDIKNVLQSLNIAKANILGQALGGRIARVFGADYPDMTNSLILVPAAGKVGGTAEENRATSKMFQPNATHEEIMEGMRYMVGDPADSERVWELIEASKVTNPDALRSEVETTAPEADWWAPEGTVPYLVLQGMLDRSAPPQNAELLKQELGSRVTLVELPDLGHLSAAEDPVQLAAAIVPYLKSLNDSKSN